MTSKILWPRRSHDEGGYLVGWNLRGFIVCIAAIVHDISLEDLDRGLAELIERENQNVDLKHMMEVCTVPPAVLGVLAVDRTTQEPIYARDASIIAERKQSASIWITVHMNEKSWMPIPGSVYCCGYRYSGLQSEVIFYDVPNTHGLQYLLSRAMLLDVTPEHSSIQQQVSSERDAFHSGVNPVDDLRRKVLLHAQVPIHRKPKATTDDMDILLHQVNSSWMLMNRLRRVCDRRKKPRLVNVVKSASKLAQEWHVTTLLSWPLITFLFSIRLFAESVLKFLAIHVLKPFGWDNVTMKELSSTAQQIDLRLQQLCFWPWQVMIFKQPGWRNEVSNRAQYISFYNSMWLIANDIILGLALGSFIKDHSQWVTIQLNWALDYYTIDLLKETVVWLMGWPAGLKLNNNLDNFLGELFLWLIYMWTVLLVSIRPWIPLVLRVIGASGVFGATLIASLVSDLVSALTLHIFVFYSVAARIYNWQLNILSSLFNLFRGKKYNVLRDRLDSCDYDLDQLLLGTIFFTLLFFLFPTVVVYYVLFCSARVVVIGIQLGLKTVLAVLNHFPLFALMLRFKDPARLPGGIKFRICDERYGLLLKRSGEISKRVRGMLKQLSTTHSEKKDNSSSSQQTTPTVSQATSSDSLASITNATRRRPHSLAMTNMDQVPDALIDDSPQYTPITPIEASSMDYLSMPAVTQQPITNHITYLEMSNVPITLPRIFFQYLLLWRRLAVHYVSLQVIKSIVYGEPIRAVQSLQYPMLPETRPSLSSFWGFLKESFFAGPSICIANNGAETSGPQSSEEEQDDNQAEYHEEDGSLTNRT